MSYYKFNPKNHLCSLVWTIFLLVTVTKETKLSNGITVAVLFGIPTVVAGVNLQSKIEHQKRLQIIKIITERQMLTVTQTANILDVPVSEAQVLLDRLYRESRINLDNRSEDMAIVYTSIE